MLALTVLGIEDPWVWLAYLLSIVAALCCIIYGIANWNRGDDTVTAEDVRWAAAEDRVEEDL